MHYSKENYEILKKTTKTGFLFLMQNMFLTGVMRFSQSECFFNRFLLSVHIGHLPVFLLWINWFIFIQFHFYTLFVIILYSIQCFPTSLSVVLSVSLGRHWFFCRDVCVWMNLWMWTALVAFNPVNCSWITVIFHLAHILKWFTILYIYSTENE